MFYSEILFRELSERSYLIRGAEVLKFQGGGVEGSQSIMEVADVNRGDDRTKRPIII